MWNDGTWATHSCWPDMTQIVVGPLLVYSVRSMLMPGDTHVLSHTSANNLTTQSPGYVCC